MYKKILICSGAAVIGVYALFLILPLFVIPFSGAIGEKISSEIKNQTGFSAELNGFRVLTTPKLTLGAKFASIKVSQPDGQLLLNSENLQAKMSLLPLLIGKIELDAVGADNVDLNLFVKKDGTFLIEDFFKAKESEKTTVQEPETPSAKSSSPLPFGLKLSNKLPDINLKKHSITFIRGDKSYVLSGSDTKVSDFILNKKVKVQSKGKFLADGFEAFNYDVKIFNKIMPDINLNDLLISSGSSAVETKKDGALFDIISPLNAIKTIALTGNLTADIKTEGTFEAPELHGKVLLDGLSLKSGGKQLPKSDIAVDFNKNEYEINSNLYTAENENTKITGDIKSGKSPKINLSCKSNATLKSIFEIVGGIAKVAGINDFKSLSARGGLDIDFNLKSDLKKINSNGKIKLSNGAIAWGAYDVRIDNLIADIALDNNAVLINKLGFSTLSIPFSITGQIKQNADCDITIQTTKLPVKGLLVSLGQAALLRENPITSGNITILAQITDKLQSPKITGDISLDNLNLTNTPSNTKVVLNPANIKLQSTKSGFTGTIEASNFKAINPAVTVSILSAKAAIDEKQIKLLDTDVFAGLNKTAVSGTISNYMTDKMTLDFVTKGGEINSALTGYVNAAKQTLDLKFSIPNNSSIIIPGFDKSKLVVNGDTTITGSMTNPVLKGQFNVPSVEIPEIPVSMKNLTARLDGTILNGSAAVENFSSGGISAQAIKSDYKLDGSVFYLKNLTGSAFDGAFSGDIAYNTSTGKCGVIFAGEKMNALKAIEGAAGIKNALTGTLGFNANVEFAGSEYNEMMKTLKGSADFQIENGTLGNLGSLTSLLNAQNISGNSLLRGITSQVSSLPSVSSASEYDYINGALTFKNGFTNINPVKMSGPSMAYYVSGKYNLINGYTDVVILGRLSESVVGVLGSLGDLSANKVTSIISGLGNLTGSLAKSMNESPKNVDLTQIPDLRSKTTKSRDFKVVFTGPLTGASSIKSFKWLNDVDTSALETSPVSAVNESVQNALNSIKTNSSQTKEDLKQTGEQAKQLFKSFLNGSN